MTPWLTGAQQDPEDFIPTLQTSHIFQISLLLCFWSNKFGSFLIAVSLYRLHPGFRWRRVQPKAIPEYCYTTHRFSYNMHMFYGCQKHASGLKLEKGLLLKGKVFANTREHTSNFFEKSPLHTQLSNHCQLNYGCAFIFPSGQKLSALINEQFETGKF